MERASIGDPGGPARTRASAPLRQEVRGARARGGSQGLRRLTPLTGLSHGVPVPTRLTPVGYSLSPLRAGGTNRQHQLQTWSLLLHGRHGRRRVHGVETDHRIGHVLAAAGEFDCVFSAPAIEVDEHGFRRSGQQDVRHLFALPSAGAGI